MTNFYATNLQTAVSGSITTLDPLAEKKVNDELKLCTADLSSSTGSFEQLLQPKKPPIIPQIFAVVVSSWPSLACGASLGFITPALPLLQCPDKGVPNVSEDHLSWMASLTMLGALVGASLSGPCLAMGRRSALWVASLPLAISWAGLALAHAPWPLLLTHTIFGLCMGIVGDAGQLYVNEVAHPSNRGALSCIPVLMFNAGTLACYVASIFFDSWRHMAWFGLGLTLPCLLIPALIPESPSYLASRKKPAAALAALERLRGSKWDASSELADLLQLRPVAASWRGRLQDLWAAMRSICLVGMVRIASRLCGIRAIMAYLGPVLAASESTADSSTATVLTGVLQWAATLAACALLDRCGRRLLLVSTQVAMAVSLVGMAVGLGGYWPLMFLSVYVVANSVGLAPVSGLLLGEMVPQQHRSVASSVTGAASWVTAFLVTKTFFDLEHLFGDISFVLYLYAAFCAIGALSAGLLLPETLGISLLEIEVQQQQEQQPQNNSA